MPEVGDLHASFLLRFAARDLLRSLAGVDDARHRLDLPGAPAAEQPRQAHLADQQHPVGRRVVRQDGHGVPALEDFALHRSRPAATEEAVAEAVAVHLEVTVVDPFVFQDLQVVGTETAVEHAAPPCRAPPRRPRAS